jgi:hypothetical protein
VRTEAVDDRSELWRTEKVSFTAAYGNERLTAFLYCLRNLRRRTRLRCTFQAPG